MLENGHYLDDYQVTRLFAAGPWADLYEAVRERPDHTPQRLMLCIPRQPLQQAPGAVQRLVDKGEAVSGLFHPNLLSVREVKTAEGLVYLAMDPIDGWSLRQLLLSAKRAGGRFPPDVAAYVAHEVATGLAYLHGTGEHHGHVVPENVFVTRDGQVKLGDFAVARAAADTSGAAAAEQLEELLPYLAPEQARGEAIDSATDVYGVGLLLFEMLTGCRLNMAHSARDLLASALNPPGLLPSHLVDGVEKLDSVVGDALQRERARRTHDGRALREHLARHLRSGGFNRDEMARVVQRLQGFSGRAGAPPEARPSSPPPPRPPALPARNSPPTFVLPVPAVKENACPAAQLGKPKPVAPPRRRARPGWRLWAEVAVAAAGLVLALVVALLGDGAPVPGDGPAPAARPQQRVRPQLSLATRPPPPGEVEVTAPAAVSAVAAPADRASPEPSDQPDEPLEESAAAPLPSADTPPAEVVSAEAERGGDAAARAQAAAGLRASRSVKAKEIAQLVYEARQRGLWPGDDAGFDALRSAAWRAVARGTGESELEVLRSMVEDFVLDRAFVMRKLRRLQQRLVQPGADYAEKQRLHRESWPIQQLINEEQFLEASRLISELMEPAEG